MAEDFLVRESVQCALAHRVALHPPFYVQWKPLEEGRSCHCILARDTLPQNMRPAPAEVPGARTPV